MEGWPRRLGPEGWGPGGLRVRGARLRVRDM